MYTCPLLQHLLKQSWLHMVGKSMKLSVRSIQLIKGNSRRWQLQTDISKKIKLTITTILSYSRSLPSALTTPQQCVGGQWLQPPRFRPRSHMSSRVRTRFLGHTWKKKHFQRKRLLQILCFFFRSLPIPIYNGMLVLKKNRRGKLFLIVLIRHVLDQTL